MPPPVAVPRVCWAGRFVCFLLPLRCVWWGGGEGRSAVLGGWAGVPGGPRAAVGGGRRSARGRSGRGVGGWRGGVLLPPRVFVPPTLDTVITDLKRNRLVVAT